MANFRAFLRFVFSHKAKYLVFFLSFLVFALLLFPFQDVGDMIGAQVAKMTGNQVFLQLDRFKVAFFPSPEIAAENVSVETPQIPAVTVQELQVKPTVSALVSQKPSGTLVAKGLFRGDVLIDLKPGKKTEAGVQTHVISLTASSLNLAEIHKVAQLPVLLKGRLNLTTSGTADPTFGEQPDFDIELKVDQLEIPPATVNTMMGPLNLPDLRLSSVDLKGRLSAGRFNIERGNIGRNTDELHGTVRGGISVLIQNRGGIAPIIGAYSFDVDLSAKKSFQDKAALFLSFLDSYKTPTDDGARFQFKISATSPQMPPNLGAAR
jgi:type II secretion system protein N